MFIAILCFSRQPETLGLWGALKVETSLDVRWIKWRLEETSSFYWEIKKHSRNYWNLRVSVIATSPNPPCSQQFVPETWSLDCIPLGFRSIPLILSWIQKQQPRPIRFWYSVPWYITMIVKPLFGSILLQLFPKVYSWWWLVTNENESISRSLPFWMAGSSHRFKTPWSFHQGGFLRTIKSLQNMLTNFQWNEFTWV